MDFHSCYYLRLNFISILGGLHYTTGVCRARPSSILHFLNRSGERLALPGPVRRSPGVRWCPARPAESSQEAHGDFANNSNSKPEFDAEIASFMVRFSPPQYLVTMLKKSAYSSVAVIVQGPEMGMSVLDNHFELLQFCGL